MLRSRGARALQCVVALIASVWATTVPAAEADLSGVNDILKGDRFLMRDDDLLVLNIQQQSPGPEQAIVQTLFTAGGQIASASLPLAANQVDNSSLLPSYSASIATGRFFVIRRDFGIVLAPSTFGLSPTAFWAVTLTDSKFTPDATVARLGFDFGGPTGASRAKIVTADFTGDSYDDALALYADERGVFMTIVTAQDINVSSSGLVAGPRFAAPSSLDIESVAVADFNGDGRADIAVADPVTGLLRIYSVDRTSLAITQAAQASFNASSGVQFQLVAGRFRDLASTSTNTATALSSSKDLVVVTWGAGFEVSVTPITFAANSLVPTVLTIGVGIGPFDQPSDPGVRPIHAIAAPVGNFFSGIDQLVIVLRQGGIALAATVAFQPDFSGSAFLSEFGFAPSSFGINILDAVAGNFDNAGSDGTRIADLQLAVLFDVQLTGCQVVIFDVDSTSYAVNPRSFGQAQPCAPLRGSYRLVAGDTQGRSLRLGPPEKVVVTGDIVPDMVLGLPPSHVDWINPLIQLDPSLYPGCDSPPSPCLLNMTVRPSVAATNMTPFATKFEFTDSATDTSVRKAVSSWSVGGKVSADAKETWGIPKVDAVSVEIKTSLAAKHKASVSKVDSTFSAQTDHMLVKTGFADYLFYTSRRMNYFYYPVIDHTVCPQSNPECSDSAKVPLYAVFSAPDEIFHGASDGTTQEWYQPVHQPGNVLSYPWDGSPDPLALVAAQFPSLTLDLQTQPDPNWQSTDTNQSTYSKSWTEQTSQGKSSGSTTTIKEDASVSTSGTASSFIGGQFSGNVTVDVNGSQSFSTVHTSTQTIAASTGIAVSKPAFDGQVGAGNFLYDFAGVIFGLQNPPSQTPPQSITLGVDVQTSGPMVTAFLANVNAPGWNQAYGARADVAVSHPKRWDWQQSTQTVSFNAPQANVDPSIAPIDLSFYHMRGLFITPAGTAALGPNRSILNPAESDGYNIRVRVYNFTLRDTDQAGAAAIKVRVYGHRYDTTTDTLVGDSFLIGETALDKIPGFNSSSNQGTLPNWKIASVPFNLSAFPQTSSGDVYLAFWALVWMEDASGNLLPEIRDHGLTSNPAGLSLASITAVPFESHSNNAGLYGYRSPFYVCPLPPNPCVGAGTSLGAAEEGVTVNDVEVPATPLLVDLNTTVTARIASHGFSGPMAVAFFDGDPARGGQLFDVHHIAHVRANDTYITKATYRPQTCGRHSLFVAARPHRETPETGRLDVDVTIDARVSLATLRAKLVGLRLGAAATPLLQHLEQAGKQLEKGNVVGAANQLRVFALQVDDRRFARIPGFDAAFFASLADLTAGCLLTGG